MDQPQASFHRADITTLKFGAKPTQRGGGSLQGLRARLRWLAHEHRQDRLPDQGLGGSAPLAEAAGAEAAAASQAARKTSSYAVAE